MLNSTKYRRLLNGLPQSLPKRVWYRRILCSWWTWSTILLFTIYAACLYLEYLSVTAPREYQGGTIPGISHDAIVWAAKLALPTLVVWTAVFLLADRLKPMRLLLWLYALGWGASIGTLTSMYLNTWAAANMAIEGNNDPSVAARSAIYSAPFVEEAMKGSILFLIAILVRYRLVSRLSGIIMGGLSGIGFAFVENILYYSRTITYVAMEKGAGDMQETLQQIVMLRGFWTSFGHPLFTSFTGIGIVVAVRSKSKIVRVLAPLLGYLIAAACHMTFNAAASLFAFSIQVRLYFFVGLPVLLAMCYFGIRELLWRRNLIRERLRDYVLFGWLPQEWPELIVKVNVRARITILALSRGRKCLAATWRLQRDLTELAFLRDSMTRGVVDDIGNIRELELLKRIEADTKLGIVNPEGLKFIWPRLDLRRRLRTLLSSVG